MEKKYHPSWEHILVNECSEAYFKQLENIIDDKRKQKDVVVLPPEDEVFNAFLLTPFHQVKVVILGQDPYHSIGQAHGLSFSVKPNVKIPPSLRNIFTELSNDLNVMPPHHGYLEQWALQGVLLLNAYLTVEESKPMAHSKLGWAKFTDKIIQAIAEQHDHIVFILWGNFAMQKETLIDASKHCIVKGVHPSPLSASRGFWGSKPFSQTNAYLIENHKTPINWNL